MVDVEQVAREAAAVATRARKVKQLAAQLREQSEQPPIATVLVEPGQGLTDQAIAALRLALAGATGEVVITAQIHVPARTGHRPKETHNGCTH